MHDVMCILVAAQLENMCFSQKKKKLNLQLVGAVSGLVHAMALFKQLEELLNGDARVGWAP